MQVKLAALLSLLLTTGCYSSLNVLFGLTDVNVQGV